MNTTYRIVLNSAALIFLFFLSANTIQSQDIRDSDLPEEVKKSFTEKFPSASELKWKILDQQYEFNFDTRISEGHFLVMDESGKVIRHNEIIPVADTPEVVIESINEKYTVYQIKSVKKMTNYDAVSYAIALESSNSSVDVLYSENGVEIEE